MRLISPLSDEERILFVAAARALVGTPYAHRGRTSNRLDCIGIVVLALAAVGRECNDGRVYGRNPNDGQLRAAALEHFGPPASGNPRPGDVLLMTFERLPQHFAIVGDHLLGGLSIIHAEQVMGEVSEVRYSDPWDKYDAEIFRP